MRALNLKSCGRSMGKPFLSDACLRCFRLFLPSLMVLMLSATGYTFAQKHILVIHSYHEKLTWVSEITSGIQSELATRYKVDIHYMDTKRIRSEDFVQAKSEALNKYQLLKPDLVILVDDNALKLMGQHIAKQTPVVFCGINGEIRTDYAWVRNIDQITGVMERPLIRRTLMEMVNATQLEAKNALVILGDSPTSKAFFKTDLGRERRFQLPNLEVKVEIAKNYQEWQQYILTSRAQGYDMVLVAGFYNMHDTNNNHIDIETSNSWVSSHSPLPIFTVHEQSIGKGKVLGGMVVSGTLMGKDAAKLVKKIIERKVLPKEVPIEFQDKGRLIFSKKELERWKIELAPKYKNTVYYVP